MSKPYAHHRDLALSVLNSGCRLSRKAGSFLGQIVAEPLPLTPAQREWLTALVDRAAKPNSVEAV